MVRTAWRLVALATTSVLSLPLALFAQAPPSADTFVSSAYPSTNFGAVNSLAVGPGSTSYLQFNLSGIPAGATVSKASLRLYVDLVSKAGKFDVYQVTKNWNESTLTYNNQPLPLGGSLTGGAGISITAASCNQFLLIDITSQVQSWVNSPSTNKGLALALVSGSIGSFFFDAKESLLTANGPELEIALSGIGPQGPAGPAGPEGPTGPQGIAGPMGLVGPVGPPGINGAQGPKGDIGPQGPAGLTWRGAFDCNGTYAVGDVVSYEGSSWVDVNFPIGGCVQPPFEPWQLLAQKGAEGLQGPQGQQGPAGLQGPQGFSGPAGLPGATGPQGPIGPVGPVGPQGPGGFIGMKEFRNDNDLPSQSYSWTAPAGVTHVMVELWGGGGGSGNSSSSFTVGGDGGSYGRGVIPVTPGTTYTITVGGGGNQGANGGDSSVQAGGQTLIYAQGGLSGNGGICFGGSGAIAHCGDVAAFSSGGSAFGAIFCPGPRTQFTGRGANALDPLAHAFEGYVLLTW